MVLTIVLTAMVQSVWEDIPYEKNGLLILQGMEEEFHNPVSADKVTDKPGLLEYAHHVGSIIIKPEDRGKIKSRALTAMREQTDLQLEQIYRQMQLMAKQVEEIKHRIEISEQIYATQLRFEPLIGHVYYLYQNHDGLSILSMVGPGQWGKKVPYASFTAAVKLMADHTWQILEEKRHAE